MCTGNICRSPLAEGFLRDRVEARRLPVTVSSTGITFAGRPATREAIAVAADRGVNINAHLSRVLDATQLGDADLIIGMERQHVREAVVLDGDALGRCFTLPELVRRANEAGVRKTGETLREWLGRLGAGRVPSDLLGFDETDEVADPFQRGIAQYELCAREIAELVDELVALAWPTDEEATS